MRRNALVEGGWTYNPVAGESKKPMVHVRPPS